MWPEGLSNAVIIVHGQDGNNYILPEDIPSVEISELQYGEEFRNALLADSAECSINLRTKKGAIDHLFSKPTMAAYRYVRSERRKKEKERRMRLKEKNYAYICPKCHEKVKQMNLTKEESNENPKSQS